MFGFETIEYFLHHFENLLDELRTDKLAANSTVVDIILKSIDHTRMLVNKPGHNLTRSEKKQSDVLIATMKDIVKNGDAVIIESITDDKAAIEPVKSQVKEILSIEETQPKPKSKEKSLEGWIVEITLTENGLKKEFDPTYILLELEEIGWKRMSFIPGAIPDIVSYDPLKPFGRWLMEFEDNCDPDAIEDVFAFIEDELRYTITSTLPEDHSILSDDDLFESPVDINTLTQETNNPFETEDFADFDTQTELETTAVEVANNSKIVNKSSTQDSKNNKLTVNSEGPVTELNSMELLKTEVFEIEDEEVDEDETLSDNTAAKNSDQQTSIRVNVNVLEDLLNLVSELVLNRNQFMQMAQTTDNHKLTKHVNQLNRLTSEIQETAMRTRMQAIGTSWTRLPRIVRDLSAELCKDV